jgi:hypothetical protein
MTLTGLTALCTVLIYACAMHGDLYGHRQSLFGRSSSYTTGRMSGVVISIEL